MAASSIKELKANVSTAISDYPDAVEKAKEIAGDVADVSKKVVRSTGKAAWFFFTTLIILGVPFGILYVRDAQIELQEEQARIRFFDEKKTMF
ncbi:hypothetical protein V2J09_014334 [Rumex salicifolius]